MRQRFIRTSAPFIRISRPPSRSVHNYARLAVTFYLKRMQEWANRPAGHKERMHGCNQN